MWYISRFSGSIPGGLALVALCGVLTAAGFADDRPTVYTTFYPTTYFAQRIGGDVAQVVCPCPADADPAYWMPKDEAIAAYQKADLIVINGASFEKWLPKVTLPESRIVDTARPLRDTLIKLEQAVTHSHGPEGEHVHHGIDGHTWVDPMNAKTQAREILKALVRKLPAQKVAFERNFAALAKDLDVLDAPPQDNQQGHGRPATGLKPSHVQLLGAPLRLETWKFSISNRMAPPPPMSSFVCMSSSKRIQSGT